MAKESNGVEERNAFKINQVPPSPASTCASRRSSRTTVSEIDTADSLNDNVSNSWYSPASYGLAVDFPKDFVEWVDSPIRPHGKMAQTDQKSEVQSPINAQAEVTRAIQNKKWVESPVHPHNPGTVRDHGPSQQPLMNFQVERPQEENVTWFCVAFAGGPGVVLRSAPDLEAPCTGGTLGKNEVFSVNQKIAGPDGRVYLHLTDGRGWAFDDSALMPEDPSVVPLDYHQVTNPWVPPCHTMATPTAHQPQAMPTCCSVCNYQMDASAKFCHRCGNKQQPSYSIAAPGSEAWSPYQIQHPVPWWSPSPH